METRFLLVRRGCPVCRSFIKVISKINLRLPIEKRIRIIDCYEWEEFGVKNIPLMDKLEQEGLSEGFPFFYIDGIIVEPFPTTEQIKIFLETYLKDEFII
ncbi:MAG: hypothetical protein ACTSR2_01555 [Candidatus Hodarchaeales archaeon]